MKKLDREAARALVDAGYMPPAEYLRLFGDECVADSDDGALQAMKSLPIAAVKLPARFAPARMSFYRVIFRARGGMPLRQRNERNERNKINRASNDWRRSG